MPNVHKHKLVGVRGAPKELVDKMRASAPEGNISAITVAFWRWYVAEENAELPDRPDASTS